MAAVVAVAVGVAPRGDVAAAPGVEARCWVLGIPSAAAVAAAGFQSPHRK